MGVPERSPMGGPSEWGMPRSSASPVGAPGHPSMIRPGMDSYNSKGMMGGPMVNRSNSVPGTRSMLQQQLMDMGMYAEPGRILDHLILELHGQLISTAIFLLHVVIHNTKRVLLYIKTNSATWLKVSLHYFLHNRLLWIPLG